MPLLIITYRAICCDSGSSNDSHPCSPHDGRMYLDCPVAATQTLPRNHPVIVSIEKNR